MISGYGLLPDTASRQYVLNTIKTIPLYTSKSYVKGGDNTKIIAEKAISKKGVPYTKITAEIWNSKKPSQPGEMYASLVGDAVKEKFAAFATEEDGRLVLMIDDKESSFSLVAEPSDYEKPFVKLLIYDVEVVDYEPRGESKDVFELRDEIKISSI